MFLCYDLIALLRDPFSSAAVRSTQYIVIAGVVSMLGAALVTFKYDGSNNGFYPWRPPNPAYWWYLGIYILMALIFLISLCYMIRQSRNQGMN